MKLREFEKLYHTNAIDGDYHKHSAPQRTALENTFPLLSNAISTVCSRITFKSDTAFTVADYGSSDGKNSLELMSIIIKNVRKNTSPTQPISIYHTDLPYNNYNTLFRGLHDSPDSYMALSSREAPIFSCATATPFFQQILPSNSVHFAFTSCSVHWLSCFPSCDIQQLYATSAPEPQRAVWRKQAAVDWGKFLSARSKEIVPGGVMVMANLFMDEQGDFPTKELCGVMDRTILEMQDIGMIDAQAARRFSHPSYFRTREEYISPLSTYGFTLRSTFSRKIDNPIYQEYSEAGNWKGFGQAMVKWARHWCNVALLRVIGPLDDVAKKKASNYFYRRVAQEVAKRPHDHKAIVVVLYMVVEKNIPGSLSGGGGQC